MSAATPDIIRILFVEDAFDQALLVKTFLQDTHGRFEVVHSQDGDAAAKLLKEEKWHLLVTDLNLPGIDGFDLCRIARSLHPTLPILAITGYPPHYQEQAFRAGATELMTKPLDKIEFVQRVEALTGSVSPVRRTVVLAVSGLVGDAEMGCGGTLLKHRARGENVIFVTLCRDEMDPSGAGLQAAADSARALGGRLELDEAALDDTQGRMALLKRLARDLEPQVAYLPAMDDAHPSRREAFRIGKATLGKVPLVLGYQTATTGMEFKPTRFEDVSNEMMDKMEALTVFPSRPDLAPRMAQAYARYWGRLQGFVDVEPFEIVQGEE